MRELRWTERSEGHIARHGVRPSEVEEAVHGRPRLVVSGRDGTEVILGVTDAGRHLLVVLAAFGDGRDGVVTAREMTLGERRRFRQRGR